MKLGFPNLVVLCRARRVLYEVVFLLNPEMRGHKVSVVQEVEYVVEI